MAGDSTMQSRMEAELKILQEEEDGLQSKIYAIDRELVVLKVKRQDLLGNKELVRVQIELIERLQSDQSTLSAQPSLARDVHQLRSTRNSDSTTTNTFPSGHESSREDSLTLRTTGATPPLGLSSLLQAHKNYPIISDRYPTVVRLDGKAFTISCFVQECQANATGPKGAAFFRGVRGLYSHILLKHPELDDIDVHEVADRCNKIELNDLDAALVAKGQDLEQTSITMVFGNGETSTKIRPASKSGGAKISGPINSIHTHVVNIDGQWSELSCAICNTNAPYDGFFGGVIGVFRYVRMLHVADLVMGDTLKHCHMRPVSDHDVGLMKQDPPREPTDVPIRLRRPKRKGDRQTEEMHDRRISSASTMRSPYIATTELESTAEGHTGSLESLHPRSSRSKASPNLIKRESDEDPVLSNRAARKRRRVEKVSRVDMASSEDEDDEE